MKSYLGLGLEISHVFRYRGYTKKQRMVIWLLCILRHLSDILSGIVGLITFGIIQTWWGCDISEKIMRRQMKYYKENKGVAE